MGIQESFKRREELRIQEARSQLNQNNPLTIKSQQSANRKKTPEKTKKTVSMQKQQRRFTIYGMDKPNKSKA